MSEVGKAVVTALFVGINGKDFDAVGSLGIEGHDGRICCMTPAATLRASVSRGPSVAMGRPAGWVRAVGSAALAIRGDIERTAADDRIRQGGRRLCGRNPLDLLRRQLSGGLGSIFCAMRSSRGMACVCFALALTVTSGDARAQQNAPGVQAGTPVLPPMTPLRYNEDYSYLDDPSRRTTEWWEPLKRLPIAPGVTLETGLELRARVESYENNLWGEAPAPDDAYLWTRALPYASLRAGPVLAFGQLGAVFANGVAPREAPVDQTGIDVVQAFVEYSAPLGAQSSPRFTARAGRMLLSLGSERLVGSRYGPNANQPFDAAVAIVDFGPRWRVQSFYARPVDIGTQNFDDVTSQTEELWAFYATRRGLKLLGGSSDLDIYYIGSRADVARYQQGVGREQRNSFGVRLAGKGRGWDWEGEAVHQSGNFGDQTIDAHTVGGILGYTFENTPLSPRLAIGGAIISGDKDPSDGKLGTFNPLFPKGRFFGEIAPLGPYNLRVAQSRASLQLSDTLTLEGGVLAYWRDSVQDAIYGIPGQIVRSGDASSARYIGLQTDLGLVWRPKRWLEFGASVAVFDAGSFLEQTGPSETIRFMAVEAKMRF